MNLSRTSERTTFKRCVQRWHWSYIEGLVPTALPSGALWFGTGIHLALAEWYLPGLKRGPDPRETWARFSKDSFEAVSTTKYVDDELEATYEEATALGDHMLGNYLDEYGLDPHWEVISPEQRFSALIPHPKNPKKAIVRQVGTFDMVYRDLNDGYVKMVDHKTAKAIETGHLSLDEQAGGYLAIATHSLREQELIGPKEAVKGMEYNFLRKAMADTRPINNRGVRCNTPQKKHYIAALEHLKDWTATSLNKLKLDDLQGVADANRIRVFGDESARQPLPLFLRYYVGRTARERNRQIRRIGEEAEVMNAFRYGKLPITKTPNRDCRFMCPFFELCEVDEAGGDVEYFKKAAFKVIDPYADHREGADNSKTSVESDRASRMKSGF